jgi:hypothetical protein
MNASLLSCICTAEGLLRNPALFSGKRINPFSLAREYIKIAEEYPPPFHWIKTHVGNILFDEYVFSLLFFFLWSFVDSRFFLEMFLLQA